MSLDEWGFEVETVEELAERLNREIAEAWETELSRARGRQDFAEAEAAEKELRRRQRARTRPLAASPPHTELVLDREVVPEQWITQHQAAERRGLVLHEPEDVARMSELERRMYLEALYAFDAYWELGWRGRHAAWLEYRKRCRGTDPDGMPCGEESRPGTLFCRVHTSEEDLDPVGYTRRKANEARMRLADRLDQAAEVLEGLLEDPELAPALKLKTVAEVFDRAGLPRQTASSVETHGTEEVTVRLEGETAADIVRGRLERLRDGMEAGQQALEAPEEPEGEVVDAELLEDGQNGS